VRTRARILPAEAAVRGSPLFSSVVSRERRARVTREEIEGRETAERIVRQARAEAEALVARAAEDAAKAAAEAVRRAEAEARAREAARWVRRHHEHQARLESGRDQLIALAVALAERLLGAALDLDAARITSLAHAVLAEARGARRAVIEAHPLDASPLREQLTEAGIHPDALEVREASALARGDLLLHTDVGTIDARIDVRFERLAAALRDALR